MNQLFYRKSALHHYHQIVRSDHQKVRSAHNGSIYRGGSDVQRHSDEEGTEEAEEEAVR
jgi:hypothetical protein